MTTILEKVRQPRSIALALIFMTMLLDVMGMTLLMPVSAYIVARYSDKALMYILVTVFYSAGQFFAAPVLGNLSDRFGRRPVLLISLFGAALGYLMFGIGGALWILLLGRVIAGITGGSMSTASAYIVDVSAPGDVAKNLTLVGMAWGIGLILGPALGGLLGQIDLSVPAYSAAAFSLLNMTLGFFWLPESLPHEKRVKKPMRPADFNALVSIGYMGRLPGLAMILIVTTVFNFAFNTMFSTESPFLISKFNALPYQLGLMTMGAGVASAVVQALFVPRLVPRFGEKPVALTCLVLVAVGGLVMQLCPWFNMLYLISFLRSAFSGFLFPILGALAVARVSSREQGVLMGVTTALNSLAAIFSPLLAGVIYDAWAHGSPYWVAAGMFVIAALLLKVEHYAPAISIARD